MTATVPATVAQRRRRPHAVRHPRDAVKEAPEIAAVPVPGAATSGSAAPTAAPRIQGFFGAGAGGHAPRTRPFAYDADHPDRAGRARTRGPTPVGVPAARHRRLPHLGPRRTSPPPAGSPCTGSPRPSRATSTCSASSGCPTTSATATGRSGCTSRSRATPSPEELRGARRAVPPPLGGLRRARQRHRRRDRRHHPLTPMTPQPASPPPDPAPAPAGTPIVVGARVAGASTALLLARAGLRVLVVDRARRGSDTLSTHALMRGGVLQLQPLGPPRPAWPPTGAPPVRRVTFHYGREHLTGLAEAVRRGRRPVRAAPHRPRRTARRRRGGGRCPVPLRPGRDRPGPRRRRAGSSASSCATAAGVTRTEHAPLVVGADGRDSLVATRVAASITAAGGSPRARIAYGYWPAARPGRLPLVLRPDRRRGTVRRGHPDERRPGLRLRRRPAGRAGCGGAPPRPGGRGCASC